MDPSGPNLEQIRYWNEQAGPKWVAQQQRLDALIGELGRDAQERARPVGGERVLDVGCGCGESALELAGRVAGSGSVLAVDVSGVMLARARKRAQAAGIRNLRFLEADAQTHGFGANAFDLVFSRFGVMFFRDPTAAFANLRKALAPGGRICFVCWQPIHRNPWLQVPLLAAAEHIELPAPPAPDAPGPFSLGDPERLGRILGEAGFADINLESVEAILSMGGARTVDEATAFCLEIGPTAAVLREAGEEKRPQVEAAVRAALGPYQTDEGMRMPCAAWIVSARSS